MERIKHRARSRSFSIFALLLFAALAALVSLALVGSAGAAPATVPLGSSGGFAVLAGSGITNTGPTTVKGDLGTYPTTTMVGVSSMTITGTNHGGDAVTQQAQTDLTAAYNNAVGQGPTSPIAADLGGLTLAPGVYNSGSSIGLTGALTLNAGGDPNAVFVFQAGSTLTTASGSQINLINGAQSCNVFWEVGSSATLGTGSTFRGSILALQSITVTTGTTVDGRILARNGAVTLDTDTITQSTCAAAPPATTTAPPATTTAPPATTTAAPATTTTPTPTPKPKPKPIVKHVVAAASATVVRARPAVRHVGLTG